MCTGPSLQVRKSKSTKIGAKIMTLSLLCLTFVGL